MLNGTQRFVSLSALALTTALSVSACGKDDAKKAAADAGASSLVGTWVDASACRKNESTWSKQSYVFTATDLTLDVKFYSADGCAAGDLSFTVKTTGSYTASNSKLDANLTKVTLTPVTDSAATGSAAVCTALTFTKGQETDVKSCAAFAEAIGNLYDIFKVEGTKLTFGKDTEALDGSTEAKRPTEYDTDVYTKQ